MTLAGATCVGVPNLPPTLNFLANTHLRASIEPSWAQRGAYWLQNARGETWENCPEMQDFVKFHEGGGGAPNPGVRKRRGNLQFAPILLRILPLGSREARRTLSGAYWPRNTHARPWENARFH